MEFKNIEERVKEAQQDGEICGVCGFKIGLHIIRKKRNSYDKGHEMYECSQCENKFRKRTVNEILRDIGERKMDTEKLSIFKLAVLNDLIGVELSNMGIEDMIDPRAKCTYKNLKKSSDVFTKFTDDILKDTKLQELFGDYYDFINELIDNKLKEILE